MPANFLACHAGSFSNSGTPLPLIVFKIITVGFLFFFINLNVEIKSIKECPFLTFKQFKGFKESFEENPVGAIDILRILMVKALDEGDNLQAADLAKSLAEFESPKLSRIDQTNTELTVDELSDEELERKLLDATRNM